MAEEKSERSTEPNRWVRRGGQLRPQLDPSADRTRLSDPRALRAYAHPTRMELVGLLRREGPLTATRAAELTGESVASCSYHLRMLAKYDLVEKAEGGRGGRSHGGRRHSSPAGRNTPTIPTSSRPPRP